jgi:hypothetical protein
MMHGQSAERQRLDSQAAIPSPFKQAGCQQPSCEVVAHAVQRLAWIETAEGASRSPSTTLNNCWQYRPDWQPSLPAKPSPSWARLPTLNLIKSQVNDQIMHLAFLAAIEDVLPWHGDRFDHDRPAIPVQLGLAGSSRSGHSDLMAQKLTDQIAGIRPLAAADVSPEGIGLVVVIHQVPQCEGLAG